MSLLDRFDAMDQTVVTKQGNYISVDGKFLVTIKKIFLNAGESGDAFIANFTIDESSNPAVCVGSEYSLVKIIDKPGTSDFNMAMADVTSFMAAVAGEPDVPKEGTEKRKQLTKVTKAALSEDAAVAMGLAPGFLNGTKVRLETRVKPQKKDPTKSFTHMNWSPA